MALSRRPPILSTLPVRVSSPVMAMTGETGLSSARDSKDVAIVIPAEGPGSEPTGKNKSVFKLGQIKIPKTQRV
ncbi:MAG: hypothetical protein BJ554DRAFT_6761 [Olpidium bornovanus]|uniref:Uncharacterized protein n=1 Tax=Olpidium bornovanus TaxID=278681 RepID=A0A8H7ZXI0_9FUNG|nr:MAG: hypothetical protein BJ554DRAFT_6761 [Olpidium bornovanus]